MASTPFTLAALATSAVSGLQVVGTREHTSSELGGFHSAVLVTDLGELIVRVPKNPVSEVQQSAELLGLSAFTEGVREQLPFAVPQTLGMTRAAETRAVVSTFLPGIPGNDAMLTSQSELLRSLSEVLVAIHALPNSIVQQAGLPMRSAHDIHLDTERLVDRATDTGFLPETVRERWNEALNAPSLWSFEPTVTHGTLSSEQLIIEEDHITGVLGWSELGLGDPAIDLSWIQGIDRDVFETVLARYSTQRDLAGQHDFVSRARFYHELEIAKWLLHGVDTHNQNIIDDAVNMLDHLVDNLSLIGSPLPRLGVLNQDEVEELLDQTPHVSTDFRSDTAEYEALDEDRVFESDFSEPNDDRETTPQSFTTASNMSTSSSNDLAELPESSTPSET